MYCLCTSCNTLRLCKLELPILSVNCIVSAGINGKQRIEAVPYTVNDPFSFSMVFGICTQDQAPLVEMTLRTLWKII